MVSPMTPKSEGMLVPLMDLSLKGEETATLATTLEETLVSAVPTLATNLEGVDVVVSPMALKLKGEMLTSATTLEGRDSDAAACPTTTNNPKPTEPTTDAGWDNPKTSTRLATTNAAELPSRPEMWAETPACPIQMLPPTRPTSLAWLAQHDLLIRPCHRRVPHVSLALL